MNTVNPLFIQEIVVCFQSCFGGIPFTPIFVKMKPSPISRGSYLWGHSFFKCESGEWERD